MKKNLLLSTFTDIQGISSNDAENRSVHEAVQTVMNNIEKGLEKVSHSVHNMSITAQPLLERMQSYDLNACIEKTVNQLSKQLPENIVIRLSLNPLPLVRMDEYKISQLLCNLIINAKEAIGRRGEIVITTELNESYIEISVVDNGRGIKQHLQEKIFDPFYSTKKEVAKTGLGLAISKDIALEHGGDLLVSSIYTQGSIFTLQLPKNEIMIH